MGLTYGFYNAYNHDRLYDALQFGSIFDGIINDGVFMSIGDCFLVKSVPNGLSLQIGTGRAWFFHTWTLIDSYYYISVLSPELLTDRKDLVVLEVNYETRENSFKILKGSGITVPTRVWTDKIHQYPIAEYLIKPGDTYIPQNRIKNLVGSDETPFVTGIIETVSISDLLIQWSSQFENYLSDLNYDFMIWFNDLRTLLDGDVATNLAAYILDLRDKWRTLHRTHHTFEPILDDSYNVVLDANGIPVEGATRFSTYDESINTDSFTSSGYTPTIPNPGQVQRISITPRSANLRVGREVQLVAHIYPNNATNPSLIWTSDDPASASVTEWGLVLGVAVKNGVTITAKTADGTVTDSVTINVINN